MKNELKKKGMKISHSDELKLDEKELTLENIFNHQMLYQHMVLTKIKDETTTLPTDNVEWFSYHIQAMVEELGEVMKADKRWKTHRNESYNKDEKKDELADVFITFINLCLFSGFSVEEIKQAIFKKIEENFIRLKSQEEN